MHKNLIYILLISFYAFSYSQSITFKISSKDSIIVIGQPFEVQTTIMRPFNSLLFCQDTLSNFYPFEFSALKTFETKLINDSTILDSAIYTLVSYAPYKIQNFKLEAGIVYNNDSNRIISNSIPFTLNAYIDSVHSEMRPLSYTPFYEYKKKSYLDSLNVLGIGVLILLTLLSIYLFRKYYLKQKIKSLESDFNKLTHTPSSEIELNNFIIQWKSFIGKTMNKNISSMTTSELQHVLQNTEVFNTLSEIDSIKYNPKHNFESINTSDLIQFANECLASKINEINEKS